jgi:hypothetical protein
VGLSGQNQTVLEIQNQLDDCRASLKQYFAHPHLYPLRFFALKQSEVIAELRTRLDEVDFAHSLLLLASIEAAFMVDFERRCSLKRRNNLTKAFRQIKSIKTKAKERVSFDRDVLEAWKEHGGLDSNLIGNIRGAMKLRHWLAHGRWWQPKFGQRYDFDTLAILAKQLFNDPLFNKPPSS